MFSVRRTALVIAVAAALVAPTAVTAQADDPVPVPTRTRLFIDEPSGATTTTLTARISSAAGVPTGTVRFLRRGAALGEPVAVDALGDATLRVPTMDNAAYRAEFTGTGGYADSLADGGSVGLETLVLDPEPTIAKLGGPGLLKLTLTMSAHAHYTDGGPAVGQTILFTLLGIPPGPSVGGPPTYPETSTPLVVCQAKVDHAGLASCKGTGTVGALVSILTFGGFASYPRVFTWDYVKLPVILG